MHTFYDLVGHSIFFGEANYRSLCLQNYLLCDEDIGGRKSSKAKELGYFLFCSLLKWNPLVLFLPLPLSNFSFFFLCLSLSCRTGFLTEDGLFDMLRASGKKAPPRQDPKKSVVKSEESPTKKNFQKVQAKCKLLVVLALAYSI